MYVTKEYQKPILRSSRCPKVTFLFFQTYAENERGRVVVYVTSLGVVREMLANCIKVRQIMRNLLVKIVEKDIFMSR